MIVIITIIIIIPTVPKIALGDRYRKFYRTLNNAKKKNVQFNIQSLKFGSKNANFGVTLGGLGANCSGWSKQNCKNFGGEMECKSDYKKKMDPKT